MRRVFGALMIALGILVAGASGLCASMFLWPTGSSATTGVSSEIATLVLVITGLPFLAGIFLIIGGYLLVRRRKGEN